jgi:FAD/FMN-containing dehydrogenase
LRLLEFIDECALNLIRQQYPEIPRDARAALFIEQNLASEDDQEVDRWTRRLTEQDAFEDQSWFGFGSSDRERFRDFRHTLPVMTLDIIRRTGIQKAGTDFAVPINKYRELHAYYKQRCEEIFTGQYNIFGHVGDANNHVHVFPASPEQVVASENLMYEFAQYVVSLGGTIAAEHGIGKAKTNLLKLMYSVGEIQAMKDIKLRLDSNWLLGQGTIFEA